VTTAEVSADVMSSVDHRTDLTQGREATEPVDPRRAAGAGGAAEAEVSQVRQELDSQQEVFHR
jgi:hypothetical protein